MAKGGSYGQKHLKLLPDSKTMDTQSYISTLHSQLSKVTEALLISEGNSGRLTQLQEQLNTAEEKIINLSRILKLQDSCPAPQDFSLPLAALENRVSALENSKFPKSFIEQIDFTIKSAEQRISDSLNSFISSAEQKQASLNRPQIDEIKHVFIEIAEEQGKSLKEALQHAWVAEQTCAKLAEDNLTRIWACEKSIEKLNFSHIEERIREGLNCEMLKLVDCMNVTVKTHDGMKARLSKLEQEFLNPVKIELKHNPTVSSTKDLALPRSVKKRSCSASQLRAKTPPPEHNVSFSLLTHAKETAKRKVSNNKRAKLERLYQQMTKLSNK